MGLWATLALAQGAPEPAAAPPAAPVHTIDSELSLGGARTARIALGIGDVAVRSDATLDRVAARLLVTCEKKPRDIGSCEEHARDLAIRGANDGDLLRVEVEGVSKAVSRRLRLRLEVRVPQSFPVEIHVRDGQVRVDDLVADTTVEVQKGTVDVTLPVEAVAELELRAGGEATVERAGELVTAKGSLSGALRWTRPGGTVRVEATSRLGDVRLVLQ